MALNKKIITLAKAIREVESGHNFEARGASGERGAYQFMPGTWRDWARDFLGDENAEMTPENQNKVAYYKIESLRNQRYSPKEIASIWNSGSPKWAGKIGVNKLGVRFDVPAYVNKVIGEYKRLQTALPEREIVGREEIEKKYQERITGTEALRSRLVAREEAAKLENNFVQSLINAPLTMLTRIGQLGTYIGVELFGSEELKKGMKEVLEEPLDLGFLGVVASQKVGVEGYKQIAGNALETAAWLVPGVKAAAPLKVKALSWFGRGFAFGAGDALREDKDTAEIITQGAITGTLAAGFGFAAHKIAAGFAKILRADSTFTKLKNKWIMGRDYVAVGPTEFRIVDAVGKKVTLPKTLFNSMKATFIEQGKKLLPGKDVSSWIGPGLLLYSPTRALGVQVLVLKAALNFLGSKPGKVLTSNAIAGVFKILSKVEEPMLGRIAPSVVSWSLSELVEAIINELQAPIKEEGKQTLL